MKTRPVSLWTVKTIPSLTSKTIRVWSGAVQWRTFWISPPAKAEAEISSIKGMTAMAARKNGWILECSTNMPAVYQYPAGKSISFTKWG
jgi:hypothetical protein